MVARPKQVCEAEGCNTLPGFNYEGKRPPRFCRRHKLEGMVTTDKFCESQNCKKRAHFNFEGIKYGRYCALHQLPGMVDWRLCEIVGCDKKAGYNFEGSDVSRFCGIHKHPGMICLLRAGARGKRRGKRVKITLCEDATCSEIAKFNFWGILDGRLCEKHKMDGMVLCGGESMFCEASGCRRLAVDSSGGPQKFCKLHMSDVKVMMTKSRMLCRTEGCHARAEYKYHREPMAHVCARHRSPGMISVIIGNRAVKDEMPPPEYDEETSQVALDVLELSKGYPPQNFMGASKFFLPEQEQEDEALHRKRGRAKRGKHKRRGRKVVCESAGCELDAECNFPGQTKRRFCPSHQLEGMVKCVPTKRSCCRAEGCTKIPSFNFEGLKPAFCAAHAMSRMVNVKNIRRSTDLKLEKPALYKKLEETALKDLTQDEQLMVPMLLVTPSSEEKVEEEKDEPLPGTEGVMV